MLRSEAILGSNARGTAMPDVICNTVSAIIDGQAAGFNSFIHDPKALNETVNTIGKQSIPKRFIDAVAARRLATNAINSQWKCPLNLQTPLTCPLPWTVVDASCESTSQTEYTFNLMRTCDFLGRNYIRIVLPEVDTSLMILNGQTNAMSSPEEIFLGAWHRDLVPRIIDEVSFFTRKNQHKLFVYSGYDIAAHNIIFGNANKEMNDLMAGEDKFEIGYDPYRVDGTALGIASYKGVDVYKEFEASFNKETNSTEFSQAPVEAYKVMLLGDINNTENRKSEKDGFADYFQRDTTMDIDEYRTYYRRNVWYEAPVAIPYDCRHSIHSRRIAHKESVIIIPLDILPFGYSIESSLPTAAIAGECGAIGIKLFKDWFDRSFYLTRMTDVPTLFPVPQHKHYKAKDTAYVYDYEQVNAITGQPEVVVGTVQAGDGLEGWVNVRSVGRFGDETYVDTFGEDDSLAEDRTATHNRPEQQVVGRKVSQMEGIVPSTTKPVIAQGETKVSYPHGKIGQRQIGNMFNSKSRTPIADTSFVDFENQATSLLVPPSYISPAWAQSIASKISIKLLQIGYSTISSIKALLTRLPNIYLTTEWHDLTVQLTNNRFELNCDLYIMAIMMWFLPVDAHGIESMRVYPHQKIDTEDPVCAGVYMYNENAQGQTLYSWDMMNLQTPAHMGLKPLLSNMGLISFSPLMVPNQMPYAVYDMNLAGKLIFELQTPANNSNFVNLRNGVLKTISMGVNGCACVNLNLFRLVF
jgi:hypothetical protein